MPALQTVAGLWRIWFVLGATQQYYPLAHSAFWIMHRVWGDDTLGYHLTNILLHSGSAILLAAILQRLRIRGAWLAAVIFALHPIEVESVAWMTELKNTLSGVFYLTAALSYLAFDDRRSPRHYALALAAFLAALATKSVTATLPAGLLVVFWWQRGRLNWRRDVRPLAPLFVIGAISGAVTAWVERTQIGATGSDFQFTLLERSVIAGRAVWFYIGKLVWPAHLIFLYPRWPIEHSTWIDLAYPFSVVGLLVILWMARRYTRAPLAALLFLIVTLAPALGFVNVFPFQFSFVADHFQYLAGLGIITLGAAGLASLLSQRAVASRYSIPVAALVLGVPLFILTVRQSRQYTSAETLYRATVAANPTSWLAYNNLGQIELDSPTALDQAILDLQAAIRLRPDYGAAHTNLGDAWFRKGRGEEALAEHTTAVRLLPDSAAAHNDLAMDLQTAGRDVEAEREYRIALRLSPNTAEVHQNLGVLLMALGRPDRAIAELREATRLRPDYAEAWDHLGLALETEGADHRFEALDAFHRATTARASFSDPYRHAGELFLRMGDVDRAIAGFRVAVSCDPTSVEAQNDLGTALLQAGQPAEAIAPLQAALKLRPGAAETQRLLSRATILASKDRTP